MRTDMDFFSWPYKYGLATGLEFTRAWLEGMRRLRTLQLKADAELLESVARAASESASLRDPGALAALQGRLACDQLAWQAAYWQELSELVRDNGLACQHAVQGGLDGLHRHCIDTVAEACGCAPPWPEAAETPAKVARAA